MFVDSQAAPTANQAAQGFSRFRKFTLHRDSNVAKTLTSHDKEIEIGHPGFFGRRVFAQSASLPNLFQFVKAASEFWSLTERFPDLQRIAKSIKAETAVMDGEIVALDRDGVPCFDGLRFRRTIGDCVMVYYAFDFLHLHGRDFSEAPSC